MQAPVGAQCAVHPQVVAAVICERCGSFACSTCVGFSATGSLCARCQVARKPLGSRGLRFLANIVDSLVFSVPVIASVFLSVMVAAAFGAEGGGKKDDLGPLVVVLALFFMFGGVVAGAAVQVLMQHKYGQSVGKRLLKLRVVRVDGSPVELWRLVLLRNVVPHVAGQLCGLIGLIDAIFIFGADQRCLHDLVADTIVVDVTNEG